MGSYATEGCFVTVLLVLVISGPAPADGQQPGTIEFFRDSVLAYWHIDGDNPELDERWRSIRRHPASALQAFQLAQDETLSPVTRANAVNILGSLDHPDRVDFLEQLWTRLPPGAFVRRNILLSLSDGPRPLNERELRLLRAGFESPIAHERRAAAYVTVFRRDEPGPAAMADSALATERDSEVRRELLRGRPF